MGSWGASSCSPAPLLPRSLLVQHKVKQLIADGHEHVLLAVEHVRLGRVGDVADTRVPHGLAELGVEGDEVAAATPGIGSLPP